MKRIYHFYLTCMTLTLTMPMMIVSAFAVDDMWTVANNIIVDVYGKIVGVSTVLAGLMSAVAVIGAKLSNIVANVTAATAVLIMVYNILTHGENNAMQTDFSTRTIRMQTVLEKKTRRRAA